MSNGPTTAQMRAWARRQMRVCPTCGKKYIRPQGQGHVATGSSWYRSDRARPDICWRCERKLKG